MDGTVPSIADVVSGKRDGLLWLLLYVALGTGAGSSILVATDRVTPETAVELNDVKTRNQSIAMDLANLRSDFEALRDAHHELKRNVPPMEVKTAITDFEARLRVLERLQKDQDSLHDH